MGCGASTQRATQPAAEATQPTVLSVPACSARPSREKVCLVGSGNWGSAVARICGQTVARNPNFEDEVTMWVHEEMIDGEPLTEIINRTHENVKYLPGVQLPENVKAVPELADAVRGATILVFVLPHQFLPKILPCIKSSLASNAIGVSLIKGIDFDENGIVLISDTIRAGLGIDVSVLMGANVANDVAKDEFCETTIGYTVQAHGRLLRELFHTSTFQVSIVEDTNGVELCGALKNIVAIGAGFCDGLGYGSNTKAAIMRIGLSEMWRFCEKMYSGVKSETFFESCGTADLITTCFGGRNRKCAEAFAASKGERSWDDIEAELLGGQKLQGTLTAREVHEVLLRVKAVKEFPLFEKIFAISYEGQAVESICKFEAIQ